LKPINTFECDKTKARSNLQKHRIKFTEACRIFNGHTLTAPSKQNLDGCEERFVSIGILDSDTAALVVWTKRINNIRVISARKASSMERDKYYAYIKKTTN
jgi:uncharacterized protein